MSEEDKLAIVVGILAFAIGMTITFIFLQSAQAMNVTGLPCGETVATAVDTTLSNGQTIRLVCEPTDNFHETHPDLYGPEYESENPRGRPPPTPPMSARYSPEEWEEMHRDPWVPSKPGPPATTAVNDEDKLLWTSDVWEVIRQQIVDMVSGFLVQPAQAVNEAYWEERRSCENAGKKDGANRAFNLTNADECGGGYNFYERNWQWACTAFLSEIESGNSVTKCFALMEAAIRGGK